MPHRGMRTRNKKSGTSPSCMLAIKLQLSRSVLLLLFGRVADRFSMISCNLKRTDPRLAYFEFVGTSAKQTQTLLNVQGDGRQQKWLVHHTVVS